MKKSIIILMLIMATFFSLKAVPAYPNPVEYKLPDGSTINVTLKGDEKVNWSETLDGYTILLNKYGFYEYAVLDSKNDLVTSGIRAGKQNSVPAGLKKHLRFSSSQINIMNQIWQIKAKENAKGFPATGNRKLICIMMAFRDKAFTKSQSDINALFNQVNYTVDGAKGSVKDLYLENSRNQLNLTTDVVGPFTASQNMYYYGNDTNGNPWGLASEAVTLADPYVNYANYDNDNDGTVDGIYIIFAGYGQEAGGGADAIWSHQSGISAIKDGKHISTYACSPELQGGSGTSLTRIGVICHEFGHVMGSRDFYDTNGGTDGAYEGTGNWDLMASGSWGGGGATPAHHNPYNKIYLYNWATATTITTPQNIVMYNSQQNNSFYRINTSTNNEYYLVENRQKVGIDQALPGHGLVIYHVDQNDLSNQTAHQGLYPKSSGTVSSDKACFPGGDNKTQFTDYTNPNMRSWAGAYTGKSITSIIESNGVVSFSFMGGAPVQYSWCAGESGSYYFSTPVDVAYGANGVFLYKYGVTGNIAFNPTTFGGDPVPGVLKSGFYKTASVGPAGYTKCADEGGSYTFSTPVDVAYGANGVFLYKYGVTGNIAFNPTTFGGDPVPNVFKSGFYKIPLRNPDNPGYVTNGLDYKYYQGTWDALPNFNSLTDIKSGVINNFGLTPANQADNFGLVYTGYISVPTDGLYTFYTTSDDGSKLFIGSTLVVNNDGLHPAVEQVGQIGLKAGKHAIKVEFFEKTGGEVLEVRYAGSGIGKQLIPTNMLYRVPSNISLDNLSATCDNSYEIYVNGALIGTGNNWIQAQNYANISLQNGTNVIAVKAVDAGGVAGFLAELKLNGQRIGTNSSWKVSLNAPSGWTSTSFNDASWAAATEYGAYSVSPWFHNVAGISTDTPAKWIWSNDNNNHDVVYFRYIIQSGNGTNVALLKPTIQSSTAWEGVSSRAVDGNCDGVYFHNSVTHTNYEAQAWWKVDLGANYYVNRVRLVNRTECGERLSNFHLDYLNSSGNVIASSTYPGTVGAFDEIRLYGTGVRFVKIQLNGTNVLSLAEVMAFGVSNTSNSPTSISEETIPQTVELSQNYPNPFNPKTTINFALPNSSNVKLSVMNAKGEIVKVLANSNYQAGNHSFDFDGSGLNSGVYFYQLVTPQKTITKKMMLLK